jgi:hypothetical protein
VTLRRYSEAYAPTGGIAAEGVRNLLGRPRLHPLELLVRESLQNSWDAHLPGETVRVNVDLDRVDARVAGFIRADVLADPPPALPLRDELDRGDLRLLSFSDRGTRGLGGPLRADERGGEPRDFVDFVRNIGQPPDRNIGAGSFGYGKGAFYLLSAAQTIIVHTRCRSENGATQSRLIGCAIGGHYTDERGVRHTGRHWWGAINGGIVDPVLKGDADRIAERIGLRPFDEGETGTTIAIIAPKLSLETEDLDAPEDPRAAMTFIADAIAWNFWPKMIALRGRPPTMAFGLTLDGEVLAVPDPRSHPRLSLFTGAMRALTGDEAPDAGLGGRRMEVWALRPRRRLGQIALRRAPTEPQAAVGPMPEAAEAMSERVHHVALMRQSELVVRYHRGPPLAAARVGYAGVFESEAELEEVFRRAEPPSHDDWMPSVLEKGERRLVNIALKRIRELTIEFAAPPASGRPDAEALPIGQFSAQLATLIPRIPGPGSATPALTAGGRPPPRGSGGSGAAMADGADGVRGGGGGAGRPTGHSGPRLEVVRHAAPRLVDGDVVLELGFRLSGSVPTTTLRAVPAVMTLDGLATERESPIHAEEPRVLGWIDPSGASHTGDLCTAGRAGDGEWAVRVTHLSEAVVRIELEAD